MSWTVSKTSSPPCNYHLNWNTSATSFETNSPTKYKSMLRIFKDVGFSRALSKPNDRAWDWYRTTSQTRIILSISETRVDFEYIIVIAFKFFKLNSFFKLKKNTWNLIKRLCQFPNTFWVFAASTSENNARSAKNKNF